MSDNTLVIGPCNCGGYGIVYNVGTKEKLGRCHDALKFVDLSCEEVISILRNPYGVPQEKIRKASLLACDIIENIQAENKRLAGEVERLKASNEKVSDEVNSRLLESKD